MFFHNLRLLINRIYIKIKFFNKQVLLKPGCAIWRGSVFECKNVIGRYSSFSGKIGRGSYIGEKCSIRGEIGRFCSIGNNVRVIIGIHPTDKFVSTHPCFYSTRKQAGFTYVSEDRFPEIKYADDKKHVVIGNDVWVGEGASIMGGVIIGDGAVIAAGALVNKDVPPYTIVGGVPAKKIRVRFSEEQIDSLIKIKWWDFPESEIKKTVEIYDDIDKFLQFCERDREE